MANNKTINGITLSQGSYNDETVMENNLQYNLLQKPAISDILALLQPKYSLSNIVNPLSDEPVEFIGDMKYRYGVLGRWEKPVTLTGNYSGIFAPGAVCTIELYEGWAHPTQTLKFFSGDEIFLQSYGSKTATGYLYQCSVVTGDKSFVFDTTQIVANEQIGVLANKNPELSKRGYGNIQYPDWLENYVTISRQAFEISRTAATAVTWITIDQQKFWTPGPMDGTNGFLGISERSGGLLYMAEKEAWFGNPSQSVDGTSLLFDQTNDNKPVFAGAGVYKQIPSGMKYGYSLENMKDPYFWVDFVSWFKDSSGMMGVEIEVDCGIGFENVWTKNMYRYLDQSGYMMGEGTKNMNGNREVTVGQTIKRYNVNGVWITVNENPIFSDKSLHPKLDSQSGYSLFSYNAVFRVKETFNSVPVIQKYSKPGSEVIYKMMPGMVNPLDPKAMMASSSVDGYKCEWLIERGFAVRVPNAIALVYRTDI